MKTGPKVLPRFACVADGCGRVADHPKSGLCHKHYARNRRHGHTRPTRNSPGLGTVTRFGYRTIGTDKIFEHLSVVTRALGKPLPSGAEVHHFNGNRADNRPQNLVICPSRAYHKLLHVRQSSLQSCGDANKRKCPFCKEWDDPNVMYYNAAGRHYRHAICARDYKRNKRRSI